MKPHMVASRVAQSVVEELVTEPLLTVEIGGEELVTEPLLTV